MKVVSNMQAHPTLVCSLNANEYEHKAILDRLKDRFFYFNQENCRWSPLDVSNRIHNSSEKILIRCKMARQVLCLPYPFHISHSLCYLIGLLSGSINHRSQGRYYIFDAVQQEFLEAVALELGISLNIEHLQRVRQSRGAKRVPNFFRKIKIHFPFIFQIFLQCLGINTHHRAPPSWFSEKQRLAWFEGYLNSSKTQCIIRGTCWLTPQLRIRVVKSDLALFQTIRYLLIQYIDNFTVNKMRNFFELTISNRNHISHLGTVFTIRRPKIQALLALLQVLQEDVLVKKAISKFQLTDFQLMLYGLILSRNNPSQEIPYTLFEQTLARSSDQIRRNLYKLDQYGFISYYKKERNREFIRLSMGYRNRLKGLIRQEREVVKKKIQYTETTVLFFICQACNNRLSYTDAINGRNFLCPHCGSKTLSPSDNFPFMFSNPPAFQLLEKQPIQGGAVS
ncbi:MAG: hypothetical protein ACTSRS_13200 [Candidatus Helarchaeota archaeon]